MSQTRDLADRTAVTLEAATNAELEAELSLRKELRLRIVRANENGMRALADGQLDIAAQEFRFADLARRVFGHACDA